MRNILHFIAFMSVLALIAGCGGGGLATVNVTGTVTFNGEPVPGATVSFTPRVPGEGDPAFGTTNENGRYVLQTLMGRADAGTTPGVYDVSISAMERSIVAAVPEGASPAGAGMATAAAPRSLIPERYNNTGTSGLEATVVAGRGARNVFDFNLTGQ